jgi:hypothetical protein
MIHIGKLRSLSYLASSSNNSASSCFRGFDIIDIRRSIGIIATVIKNKEKSISIVRIHCTRIGLTNNQVIYL